MILDLAVIVVFKNSTLLVQSSVIEEWRKAILRMLYICEHWNNEIWYVHDVRGLLLQNVYASTMHYENQSNTKAYLSMLRA